jgi:transposase-like protein
MSPRQIAERLAVDIHAVLRWINDARASVAAMWARVRKECHDGKSSGCFDR